MRKTAIRIWLYGTVVLASVYAGGCVTPGGAPFVEPRSSASTSRETTGVKQALYGQLDRWKGTRYRLGGLGGNGIDCSGLAYVVYRDLFDERLPRTTEEQGRIGRAVARSDLEPGDLVFFETGAAQKHVGVYVEDGLFLHASRSSGVRMSSLASEYWRKRYWKARRMATIRAET